MSVNPKIYSKCLSADENRSFSYLVTNENAVIACGVTTKGKILTLERLGAAYCLKLYCLTTNSQKWERILQKDMKVLQYSNINIFVINDDKHAFELVDRDESVKLYEKIRGCIKKLSATTSANPASQATGETPRPKQKPVRPPPTYRTSINRQLQSNVLTVHTNIVNDLVDVSNETPSSTPTTNNNAGSTSTTTEGTSPSPRIRYPEETSRSALPNKPAVPIINSPLLNDRRIPLPRSPVAQSRTLSVNLTPTIENTRIPIPSPRRNVPNASPTITVSPAVLDITQDVGIPIVGPVREARTPTSQAQINSTAVTVLSRQNSADNALEGRSINNGSLNSTPYGSNGSLTVTSPMLNRRVPNLVTTSACPVYSSALINSTTNISTATSGYEPASTSNIIASVINSRNVQNNIVSNGSNSTATSNAGSSRTPIMSSALPTVRNPRSPNSNEQTSPINPSANSSFHTSTSSPNLSNNRVRFAQNPTTQSPINSRRIVVDNSNFLPAPAGPEPSARVVTTPVQLPRRRERTANAVNRQRTRSAFVQPASMVTDIIVQVRSRFFPKDEEKPAPKCMVIGTPTNVTHKIHLNSLDFRNMHLQDTQLKGLIKSKSMENLSSLNPSMKLYDIDDDGPTCVICLTDPPTHVIVPCGHKILCEACVQQNVLSKLRRKWCMTCNGVIREIIKVYD